MLAAGMALLVAQAWSDISHERVRLVTFWIIVAFSGILVATAARIIPGGPFISVHADILPLLGCLALLVFGGMGLRRISTQRPLILSCAMGVSLALIAVVITNVVAFWREPFARGALFGW
jgi:hypothetical protein